MAKCKPTCLGWRGKLLAMRHRNTFLWST